MKRVLSTLTYSLAVFGLISFVNVLADQKSDVAQSQQQVASATETQATQQRATATSVREISKRAYVEKVKNPNIDMERHLKISAEAAKHRETRLVKEHEFIRMSKGLNFLVLDCRSKDRFEGLHVQGAKNLPFSDITVESLEKMIPNKETPVLIYCNNNFVNDPKNFPTKMVSAALNISTYITLYDYGYRNIYELGEVIDMKKLENTKIAFEGTELKK